ncbi:MAG: AAA family ATPase [Chloroflexi bacterium]|nr:AAA family ATPase [Chloroflexota bacterium]
MAEETPGITEISVAGFKSIEKGGIEIRPLTILAGANSSGKSSIMQPMLLMKQTLDVSYDPGPLLLYGPHVQFTQYEQLLPKTHKRNRQNLIVGYEFAKDLRLSCKFQFIMDEEEHQRRIKLSNMTFSDIDSEGKVTKIYPSMPVKKITEIIHEDIRESLEEIEERPGSRAKFKWQVKAERCFLDFALSRKVGGRNYSFPSPSPIELIVIKGAIEKLIHVPGLRGNPERTYHIASTQGSSFPGTFENYIAGLILRWQEENDERLNWVGENLRLLGLTSQVSAKTIDDVNVELHVGRLPVIQDAGLQEDTVSIADVGFGVSQVLPVLVALAVAQPGQMVYIEQPELHLHPRAQVALAEVLADAANRGVRVVVETHSSLLLLSVMTKIARDKIDSDKVKLHWFERNNETGKTKISSRNPDESGSYGDWPQDFADVELDAHGGYLDAVAEREFEV